MGEKKTFLLQDILEQEVRIPNRYQSILQHGIGEARMQKLAGLGFSLEMKGDCAWLTDGSYWLDLYPNQGSSKALMAAIENGEPYDSRSQAARKPAPSGDVKKTTFSAIDVNEFVKELLACRDGKKADPQFPLSSEARLALRCIQSAKVFAGKSGTSGTVKYVLAEPYARFLQIPDYTFTIISGKKKEPKHIKTSLLDSLKLEILYPKPIMEGIDSYIEPLVRDPDIQQMVSLLSHNEQFFPNDYLAVWRASDYKKRRKPYVSSVSPEKITCVYRELSVPLLCESGTLDFSAHRESLLRQFQSILYAREAAEDLMQRAKSHVKTKGFAISFSLKKETETGATLYFLWRWKGHHLLSHEVTYGLRDAYKRRNSQVVAKKLPLFKEKIKELQKLEKAQKTQEAEQLKNLCDRLNLYGNPLVSDLCQIVENNKSFITKATIVSALRGTSIRSSAPFKPVDGTDIYNMIPAEDIEKLLSQLCRIHVLYARVRKGDYGEYLTYEPGNLNYLHHFVHATPQHFSRILPNPDRYSYADWGALVCAESEQAELQLTGKEWEKRLTLLERPELYCRYKTAYLKLFSRAPQEITTYIALMGKCGNRVCRDMKKELKL